MTKEELLMQLQKANAELAEKTQEVQSLRQTIDHLTRALAEAQGSYRRGEYDRNKDGRIVKKSPPYELDNEKYTFPPNQTPKSIEIWYGANTQVENLTGIPTDVYKTQGTPQNFH